MGTYAWNTSGHHTWNDATQLSWSYSFLRKDQENAASHLSSSRTFGLDPLVRKEKKRQEKLIGLASPGEPSGNQTFQQRSQSGFIVFIRDPFDQLGQGGIRVNQ